MKPWSSVEAAIPADCIVVLRGGMENCTTVPPAAPRFVWAKQRLCISKTRAEGEVSAEFLRRLGVPSRKG